MEQLLHEAGFQAVQVITDGPEFFYQDEETWWQVQWSHGVRYMLEAMSEEGRQQFKAQAFEQLQTLKQAEGLPHRMHALYSLAHKPQEV